MTTFGIHILPIPGMGSPSCARCGQPAALTPDVSPRDEDVRRDGDDSSPDDGVVLTWWLIRYDIDPVMVRSGTGGTLVLAEDPMPALQFGGPFCSSRCAHRAVTATGPRSVEVEDDQSGDWYFEATPGGPARPFRCEGCSWNADDDVEPWIVVGYMPGDSCPMTLVADGPTEPEPGAKELPRLFCSQECAALAALDAHLACLG